ncbi:MAG: porin [Marinovum sp.]|jgi:outer membrane protein OmpU|nr:porin [Marinovum sp.]
MKKVLLTTTALVMTAGVAAADVTLSGSAKLTYGDWDGGTTTSWGSTTDLSIAMSGEASGVAYSAGLSLDESNGTEHIGGTMSLSSNGLSLSYGPGMDADAGEASDETGDLKVAYASGGVTISYVENADGAETASNKGSSKVDLGYTMGDITLGLSTNSTDKSSGGAQVNTLSVGFTSGDMKISVSGNDAAIGSAAKATWDASVAYTLGASTVTLATDEASATAVSVSTSLNDITLSAKAKDTDNELSVGYTMGDITLSYAYDEGAGVLAAADGDDAQTIMSISYDLGGIVLKGQSNNKNEVQVSAAFTF